MASILSIQITLFVIIHSNITGVVLICLLTILRIGHVFGFVFKKVYNMTIYDCNIYQTIKTKYYISCKTSNSDIFLNELEVYPEKTSSYPSTHQKFISLSPIKNH